MKYFFIACCFFIPFVSSAQQITRFTPANRALRGISACPVGAVVVVGDSATILTYQGDPAGNCPVIPNPTLDPSVTLYAVSYFSLANIVVAGSPARGASEGTISWTKDGGQTWALAHAGGPETIRALAYNGNDVLLGVGDAGLVIRSTDSGQTWRRLSTITTSQLNAISFGTPGVATAVGNDTTILQTTDTGKTWTRMPFPYDLRAYDTIVHQIDFTAVAMVGPDTMIVGMERPVMPLTIIRGGVDTSVPISLFPNSGPLRALLYCHLPKIAAFGATEDDYSYFLDSLDGKWRRHTRHYVADADGGTDPAAVRDLCVTAARGVTYVGGENSLVEGSFDSLQVFSFGYSVLDPISDINFLNVSILPSGCGFAVSTGGYWASTTNGGLSWNIPVRYTLSSKYPNINSVFALDSAKAIMSGWDGLLWKTYDEGFTWDTLQSGTQFRLHGIAFPTKNIGIVTGDYGYIIRSADTGNTWTSIPTTTTQYLYDVAFANSTTGVCVGDSGTILRTTDTGAHWAGVNNVLTGTNYSIRQVQAFPDGTFLARAGTQLIRSTDFGQNWITVSQPVGDSLGMSFYSPQIGIIAEAAASSALVPDTAFFRYTTDAGSSWEPFSVPIWNDNRILFHWLNDHQVLMYGIAGFVVLADISTSGVQVTRIDNAPQIQLYPNPTSGNVNMTYSTKANGPVTIELWNEAGNRVAQLFNGEESTGSHQRAFTLPKALHGAFFLRVSADGTIASAKINIK